MPEDQLTLPDDIEFAAVGQRTMTLPAGVHMLSRGMAQPIVEPCGRGIIDAEPCPRALGRETTPRRRRIVLAACVLASAMAFIDGSALSVALPMLRAAFDADLASVQWVLNVSAASARA